MNLSVKFINFRNHDVVATSGCAYEGRVGTSIFRGTSASDSQYYFFENDGGNTYIDKSIDRYTFYVYDTDGSLRAGNVNAADLHLYLVEGHYYHIEFKYIYCCEAGHKLAVKG